MDGHDGHPDAKDRGENEEIERDVPQRFRALPPRIDPKAMITSQESEPPPDPEAGRDTDRDFMLRYSG